MNFLHLLPPSLRRNRGYTALNVLGLSLGISCCLVLSLLVYHEVTFDQHHTGAENIYRVNQYYKSAGKHLSETSPLMAENLLKDLPEVEQATSIAMMGRQLARPVPGGLMAYEAKFAFADSNFFKVFTYKAVAGDLSRALATRNAVVITERMAQKYFGKADPIGQTLKMENDADLVVAAVLADDQPGQSHLQLDAIGSFVLFKEWFWGPAAFSSWWYPNCLVYVRLHTKANIARLNAETLPAFIKKYREPGVATSILPHLAPVTDLHLRGENPGEGSIGLVLVLAVIAVLVLFIASINYSNLAIAQGLGRSKEVGLRKTVGASRWSVSRRFLSESGLVVALALVLSLGISELALPLLYNLTGVALAMPYASIVFWALLAGFWSIVTLIAGAYPALYLSRLKPVVVFQGRMKLGKGYLHRALITVQFVVTIALISGTIIIYNQLQYMQHKALGYDTERVLLLQSRTPGVNGNYTTFKRAAETLPEVTGVAAAGWQPGTSNLYSIPAEVAGQGMVPNVLYVSDDFLDVMGFRVKAGRAFKLNDHMDSSEAFLANEALISSLGLTPEEALDKPARVYYGEYGKISYEKKGVLVGILPDFHATNLKLAIAPALLTISDQPFNYNKFYIKLAPGDTRRQLEALQTVWTQVYPDRVFEPEFLDDGIAAAYQTEQRLASTIGLFAGLAIFLSCLGLFGLSAYLAQARTKEIGLRKVLGASTPQLVMLLSRQFLLLIGLALVVAVPLSYWLLERWLAGFAYHLSITALPFLLAGGLAFLTAFGTLSYQSIRAARSNPVDALRYE